MTKRKKTVLIVDDDLNYIKITQKFLENKGYDTIYAENGEKAIPLIKEKAFEVLLLDKNLPNTSGIEILKNHLPAHLKAIIIMVTAEPSISTAVEAIKLGAHNYISKPCDNQELLFKIEKELQLKEMRDNVAHLQTLVEDKYNFQNMVGNHPKIMEIQNTIYQLKSSAVTILIAGETGTGKGLLAKAIHYNSDRKNNRFVIINVGTLSENVLESELFGHVKGSFTGAHKDKIGLFQTASGGTSFIDDIEDMSPKMQLKLLRVIQDKEFEPVGSTKTVKTDIRIIAASNKNLKNLVQEGKFREDLYYRLNVVHLTVPPLRERKEDILSLSKHFIKLYCKNNNIPDKEISPEVLAIFSKHSWPGNIRELENCIERMVLLEKKELLSPETLPPELLGLQTETAQFKIKVDNQKSNKDALPEIKLAELVSEYTEKIEKDYLIQLLTQYKGQVTKAAKIAGLDRKTIYRKIAKYKLNKKEFKAPD